MLIKTDDDTQTAIAALEELLGRPSIDASMRARIDQEIRATTAAWRARRDAADEIEFHFGNSRNYATIHDLRVELDGQVAQVDHLVISRLLQVWVCSSSSYQSDVWISDQGQWTTQLNGRRVSLPSPIEQNRRQIGVLQRFFESGVCSPPRRLGGTITPEIRPVVLLAAGRRLTRAGGRIDGLETVIKADKLRKTIGAQVDDHLRGMLRVVGQAELERFATELAGLHRPPPIDFEARFGLGQPPAPAVTPAVRTTSTYGRSQPTCQRCHRALNKQEAWFCRLNKRFSGGYYCTDCQHGSAPMVRAPEPDTRPAAQP